MKCREAAGHGLTVLGLYFEPAPPQSVASILSEHQLNAVVPSQRNTIQGRAVTVTGRSVDRSGWRHLLDILRCDQYSGGNCL